MASFTLTRPDLFPSGTVVSVYPAHSAGASSAARSQSVTSATATGASVTFTGLTDDVPYVAHASVASGFAAARFRVNPAFVAAPTWQAKVAARRSAIGTA